MAADVIVLDRSVFAALPGAGALSADNFFVIGGAQGSDDYILYSATSGTLFYDADGFGSGTATTIAVIVGSPDGLDASDFVVI